VEAAALVQPDRVDVRHHRADQHVADPGRGELGVDAVEQSGAEPGARVIVTPTRRRLRGGGAPG
jgi:hypothetical protein